MNSSRSKLQIFNVFFLGLALGLNGGAWIARTAIERRMRAMVQQPAIVVVAPDEGSDSVPHAWPADPQSRQRLLGMERRIAVRRARGW